MKFIFYKIAFLSLLIIFSCESKKKPKGTIKKPLNVVFILTDDQGAHLSAYGTKGLSTPNIDNLAKEGMLFTNAFASVASCSPSRSSIMTGMYPHSNGHWRNTITPKLTDDDIEFGRQSSIVDKVGVHEYVKTLPEILQKNNYQTALTQKFHMSPPWKFPYSERINLHRRPEKYKEGLSTFIDNARSNGKPFYFQANISPPHRNYDQQLKGFEHLIPNPDSIEVPPYLPDTPMMREDLAKYYGCVQLADACVGAIIETLKAKGVYDNTLIIYTGDQGEPYHRAKASPYYAGLHVPYVAVGPGITKNEISEALISHIDIMPTILEFAEIAIPETVQGTSLLPLFTDKIKSVNGRKYIFGEHNSHGPPREEHYPSRAIFDGRYYYILNTMPGKDHVVPADLAIEKGWGNRSYHATVAAKDTHPEYYRLLRLLESGRPPEELYDIKNDPGQFKNLIKDKGLQKKLSELRSAVAKWRIETGDVDDPINIPTRTAHKP